ncbi:MAG: zinc ribbon domain-containing protein, partial [Candidatus Hermodarchaeota archaeon]
ITIEFPPPIVKEEDKPIALFSADLGAKKDATAVLLTSDTRPAKTGERPRLTKQTIWFFTQPKKKQLINNLDNQIAELQRLRDHYNQWGADGTPQERQKLLKGVHRKLQQLRHKRQRIAVQYDYQLVNQMLDVVQQLEQHYTVYIVIGHLQGLRHSWRRGHGTSNRTRRELHRWAYARITSFLAYKLPRIGLPPTRLLQVSEAWTSRTCHRCGSRHTKRPFQALLICEGCGAKHQADINGAMNIALKLIISLLDTTALDHWLRKEQLQLKQERKKARLKRSRAVGRKNNTPIEPKTDQTPSSVDQ